MKILNTLFKSLLVLVFFIGLYCGFVTIRENILLNKETPKTLKAVARKKDNTYSVDVSGDLVSEKELEDIENDGVNYENQYFNYTYYPYYQMLNDNEKELYNQLYANIQNYISSFKVNATISINEAENAIEAVYNDHPEFFWLDSSFSYKYTQAGQVVQVSLTYNSTVNDINTSKIAFENATIAIIAEAKKLPSDYDKEKYVHDAILSRADYDLNSANNQSAYSALVSGRTVCAGYARAFQYIMIELGIPTYYVTGYSSSQDHAWNIIFLNNEYYNVDLTWDDSVSGYTFFNLTDSSFASTHSRSGLSINLPSCNGTKYSITKSDKVDIVPKNEIDSYNNNPNCTNTDDHQEIPDNHQEITDNYQEITDDYGDHTDDYQETTDDYENHTDDYQETTSDSKEIYDHEIDNEIDESCDDYYSLLNPSIEIN